MLGLVPTGVRLSAFEVLSLGSGAFLKASQVPDFHSSPVLRIRKIGSAPLQGPWHAALDSSCNPQKASV